MKVHPHSFLTSVIDGGDWWNSCPRCFIRRERENLYCLNRMLGDGDGMDFLLKEVNPGFDRLIFQPVV